MATTQKYATPNTVETVLSTELNSLNIGTLAVSSAIDNSTGLYKFADFEIYTNSGSGNQGTYHSIYLVESIDGTNYADSNKVITSATLSSFDSFAQLIGEVALPSGAGATRKVIRRVLLPPTKFIVAFINGLGATMASSGNTVRMIRYSEQNT